MPIHQIHTYLVRPQRHADGSTHINGTTVGLSGPLFDLLNNVYCRSDQECNIDITFRPTADGVQQNACRDLIRSYVGHPTLATGKLIAERLARNTDGRSGLGLLFLIAGTEASEHKVVVSRFPTDNAIYVDEDLTAFSVEFLERVFMKNKASYKAVVYRDDSLQGGFWSGRATDRQINSRAGESSNYWIIDFLASQFTVTSAAGTRRLANAIRDAVSNADTGVKQELSAVATLAPGLGGQTISINEFGERFSLSESARAAIAQEVSSAGSAVETFEFDPVEYQRRIGFRSMELDNGAVLTAPSDAFDQVFHQEVIDESERRTRVVTEGVIVSIKLKANA